MVNQLAESLHCFELQKALALFVACSAACDRAQDGVTDLQSRLLRHASLCSCCLHTCYLKAEGMDLRSALYEWQVFD